MTSKESVTEGKNNVFEDLEVLNPIESEIKVEVALKIMSIISHRHLKQEEAASILGLTQNKISNLKRGKLKGFSLAKLFEILNKLDRNIEIRIKTKSRSQETGVTELVYS